MSSQSAKWVVLRVLRGRLLLRHPGTRHCAAHATVHHRLLHSHGWHCRHAWPHLTHTLTHALKNNKNTGLLALWTVCLLPAAFTTSSISAEVTFLHNFYFLNPTHQHLNACQEANNLLPVIYDHATPQDNFTHKFVMHFFLFFLWILNCLWAKLLLRLTLENPFILCWNNHTHTHTHTHSTYIHPLPNQTHTDHHRLRPHGTCHWWLYKPHLWCSHL